MTAEAAHDLERELEVLRHTRHGYYGTVLRDHLLHALPSDVTGINSLLYRVLRFVEADPADTVTVTQVAQVLLCERARASRIVRRLVDAGLLELRTSPADARQRRLLLTPLGRELLAAAGQARHRHLLATLMAAVSAGAGTATARRAAAIPSVIGGVRTPPKSQNTTRGLLMTGALMR